MKRALPLFLVLALACTVITAPPATAGFLDKWSKKEAPTPSAPRYDLYPTMSFFKGTLGYGLGNSWELDGVQLLVSSDCQITSDFDGDPQLDAGKEALVQGVRLGGAIIAHRVRITKPDYMHQGAQKSSQVIPSEVDPTVGEGTGPE